MGLEPTCDSTCHLTPPVQTTNNDNEDDDGDGGDDDKPTLQVCCQD